MMQLLFYRGTGLLAWFIRWFTGSKFSHVAPCVNGTIYNAFPDGVSVAFDTASAQTIITIDVTEERREELYSWLNEQVGKSYDWVAVFLIIIAHWLPSWLTLNDRRQGKWWCSHLSAVAAGVTGQTEGLSSPITPQELYDLI
jgi:uncharacterized protein YycO